MNRVYSVIWSYTKECYVVASELASQKGRASRRGRFKLSFFLLLFSFLFGSPSLSGEIEAGNNYMSANMLEDGSFPSSNLEQISSVNDDAEKKNTKQKEVFLNGVDSHRNNSFVLSPFISNRALAPDDIAIVIGKGAVGAELQGVVAIGDNAVTDNQGGIAIGHSAKATEGSISIGWNAQTATRSVSIGDNSAATGILATSLGPYAKANSENSVAIGNASEANEELVVSFGNNALKRKVINIAAGDISDNSTDAINGSQLYVTNKRVEKSESDITTIKTNITNIENKVSTGSLGLLQLSADKRSLVIDNAVANVADTFTLAKKDGTGRTLTGVLRGKADLDAVNVSQLKDVTNALGGGAEINVDGSIKAPTYKVGDKQVNSVGDAITNIDQSITNINKGEVGLVQLDKTKNKLVIDNNLAESATTFDFSIGENTRTLAGITAGKADMDAVNVSQLKGVTNALGGGAEVNVDGSIKAPTYNVGDKEVSSVGDAITNIDQSITNINKGEVGLVKLADDRIILDNKIASGADTFDFSNKDESDNPVARKLTGVAAGGIASDSLDAINGSQLYTANSNVAKTLGGDAKLDEDGQLTGVNFQEALGADNSIEDVNTGFAHVKGELDTTNKNVTNVTAALGGLETDGTWKLELGKDGNKITANNVKDAFKNIDDRVIDNSQSITNIENKVSTGSLGLLQLATETIQTESGAQEVKKLVIDNQVADVADTFTLVKRDGEGRTLTGVAAGKIADNSTDAINGSQLHAANSNVAKALGGSAKLDEDGQLTGVNFQEALGAKDELTNVYDAFKNVGGTLSEHNTRISENATNIANIENKVSTGSLGLLQLSADKRSLVIDNEVANVADTFTLATKEGEGRTLTGVAAGKIADNSTDAINGSQLHAANSNVAKALGGSAKLDEDGQLTGVNFQEALGADNSIDDVNTGFAHVKDELDATNKNVTNVTTALGGLETDGTWKLELGKDGNKITVNNVKEAFKNIDDRVIDNSQSITNIENKVSTGSLGLLQLSADKRSLVIDNAVANVADTFTLATKDGKGRTLTGVKAGKIADNSTDSINGSQLHMANSNVANALGGKAELNEGGQLTGVNFQEALEAKDELTNVYDAFKNVGGTLSEHNTRISENTTNIANIENKVSTGSLGLLQLSADKRSLVIDNAVANVADTFTLATKDGKGRTLTGVSAGKIADDSLDAINGSQLYATHQNITNIDNRVAKNEGNIVNLQDQVANITNNTGNSLEGIADALGGGAIFSKEGVLQDVNFADALNASAPITSVNEGFEYITGRLDGQEKQLDDHENRITNIEGNISNIADGKAGLIQVSEDGNSLIIDNELAKNASTFDISNGDKDLILTGVKDGQISSESKDAINGSQLYASNQSIAEMFGGGATIDADGYITTPEYVIGDKTFNNVGASIEHLANSITAGEVGIFQLDREKNQIIIADNTDINSETTLNVGNRKIVGVANGKVEKGSQEVVNGGQLWETNQQVTSNSNQIKHINKTLDHYNHRISNLEKTVHENRKRASAGTASAMAMSSIPYMDYAKYSMGMGVASYDGEAAMSIGMEFKLGDNGRFRVQGSYDTQNKAGVGVGIAFSF